MKIQEYIEKIYNTSEKNLKTLKIDIEKIKKYSHGRVIRLYGPLSLRNLET